METDDNPAETVIEEDPENPEDPEDPEANQPGQVLIVLNERDEARLNHFLD